MSKMQPQRCSFCGETRIHGSKCGYAGQPVTNMGVIQKGATAMAERVDALERGLAESNKRLNALMVILEKLQGTAPPKYEAQFNSWPGNAR